LNLKYINIQKLQLSFIKMIFIKLIKVYADLDTKNKYYKIVIFCNIRITTNPIFYITM